MNQPKRGFEETMVHARKLTEWSRLLLQTLVKHDCFDKAPGDERPAVWTYRGVNSEICSAVLFLSALVSLSLTSNYLSAAEAKLQATTYLPIFRRQKGNAKSHRLDSLEASAARRIIRAADW